MKYKDYLTTSDWKSKRFLKLSRKNSSKKRCSICASMENLDVHHLNYKNLFDVQQSDLIILCRSCHFLAHRLFRDGKFRFKNTSHFSRFAIIKNAVKKELGISGVNMFKSQKTAS